jgi:transposase
MNTVKTKSQVGQGTTILAIDLGKYNSVACAYDRATASPRFSTLVTSRAEVEKLLERTRPDVVVIEACTQAGWVHDVCVGKGLVCKVANTASEAWKFKHTKRKTDKDDALRLAQLDALEQLPTVPVPSLAVRQWRALIAARDKLLGRRVAVQNQIRAYLLGQGLPAPRGQSAWSKLGLQGIEQYARPLAECAAEELWRGLLNLALTEYRQLQALLEEIEVKLNTVGEQSEGVQLLQSIPGVGPRTAEVVAAYLDEPSRFRNAKQVSAYAGLVPRQFQSGEQDRRGRITRRGPSLLRKLLVECAWSLVRYNVWGRAVYQRLTHGGKTQKKRSIVALARKLLVRCWAMLRDKSKWHDEATAHTAPA